jgi:hypothetical protein
MKPLDETRLVLRFASGSPIPDGPALLGNLMKLRIMSAALAAAGLLASASQAAASGFDLTFTGVVYTGSDATNIFGLGAGASLVDQAITESFHVDYAGGGNHNNAGGAYSRSNIGGAGFMTSAVTINGVTTSVGSDTGIDERTDYHLDPVCAANPACKAKSAFSEFTGDESFSNFVDPVTHDNMHESWFTNGGDFGQALGYHPSLAKGPPVFTPADNLDLFGVFTISHELFDQTRGSVVFDHETTARFNPDTVSITTFGGVPEPAAWALMLLGFGGMGAVLRRRRSAMIPA